MNVINRLRALKRNTAGQDLLEYALLIALIALVAYGAVQLTGTNVNSIFTNIATKLGTAAGAGAEENAPMTLMNRLAAHKRDTAGQDLLEYALLVALIALVAYGAVELTGTNVNTIFTTIASKVGTAAGAGA